MFSVIRANIIQINIPPPTICFPKINQGSLLNHTLHHATFLSTCLQWLLILFRIKFKRLPGFQNLT